MTLNAPDGLFLSSFQTSDNSYFASNISPVFFPFFPTYDKASWWTLNHAPGDNFPYYQPLGSTANFMDDMDDGSIQFDADMGDGWVVFDYINTSMGLPITPNLKLLGQFTTLGQSGICGQLNLEIRTHFDGEPTQFEQAHGLTFSTPGAGTPCEPLTPCPEGADLDDDGFIGTSEVLVMLAAFGDSHHWAGRPQWRRHGQRGRRLDVARVVRDGLRADRRLIQSWCFQAPLAPSSTNHIAP